MTVPKPLLIVGSPRSGTTLIGTTLGTAAAAADLGEYAGYDFCYRIAHHEMAAMPGPATPAYLCALQRHAHAFPRHYARGKDWFVASAPWNLLVADRIAAAELEALFVLCFRRVEGVSQSLARSYASGRSWAGENAVRRIDLWCQFYAAAAQLPVDRTVLLDYDELLVEPASSIERLLTNLQRMGYPAHSCDLAVLSRSHATELARPTIATIARDGTPIWHPRPSWDVAGWSDEDRRALEEHEAYRTTSPMVHEIVEHLRAYRRT